MRIHLKNWKAGFLPRHLQTRETKIAAPIPTSIPPPKIEGAIAKESPIKSPASAKVEETVTVSFPVLVDNKILKKIKEPIIIDILNLCDGGHTIDDISEELKIPKARVMIVTGDYSAKGALKYLSGIRKIKK